MKDRRGATTTPPELFVRARKGVSTDALVEELTRLNPDVETASIPQDVVLLHNVRTLPMALAAFLVLLAIAAVGHALVTTVRRRRQEFAILRAIGFRPRQARACIAWQATTVGTVALLLGIPLGIAAGRLAWRWTADATPLLYNALAALPARRAGRIRPAVVLRTE